MDGHGQPALLYIVPFILGKLKFSVIDDDKHQLHCSHSLVMNAGTFFTLGKKRGELKILWSRGEPEWPCPHIQLQPSQ